MAEWKIERLLTPALHGLSTGPNSRRALHFHGSWGNFYENAIALDSSSAYLAHNYGYASVNTRGHDAGTFDEDLAASTQDIGSWIDHFSTSGAGNWILQGHSLGALKVIRALLDGMTSGISAAVLLSPFDLPAFYTGSGDESTIWTRVHQVERMLKDRPNDESVPKDLFDLWPVSLGTYLSAITPNGPLDVFRTRSGPEVLVDLGVPTLVILGGSDFAAWPRNDVVAEALSSGGTSVALIEGAPHNFAGFEPEVVHAIQAFLRNLD